MLFAILVGEILGAIAQRSIMQYQIFVQNPAAQRFTASVVGIPACVAEGPTKEEALASVRLALAEQLAQGEFVTLDLVNAAPVEGGIIPNHPWMKYAGMWADDPQIDEFVEAMKQFREEENREDFDAALDPGY
jgi:predicted RNase H-like HicB family nuclease